MKKLVLSAIITACLCGSVDAKQKKESFKKAVSEKVVEVEVPGSAVLRVIFSIKGPGDVKIGGRLRRRMRKVVKEGPKDPILQALAYLKLFVQKKKTAQNPFYKALDT